MTTANTQVYDKAIDRAAMVRLYERRVVGKVDTELSDHSRRLNEILLRNDPRSVAMRQRLMDDIDEELLRTHRVNFNTTSRSLIDLFLDQASYAYQNIEVAMGKIWETERPKTRLAEDVVLNRPLYAETTLASGWAGVSSQERKRLDSVIRRGISEGRTVDQIALDVRRGNVHSITRNQARGLVVTGITSVASQADQAVYKANAKAIRGYQYVAILDSRTSSVCAHRNGKIFPSDDTVHLPPAHFNCRSTTVPVFKSWSDIANLEGVAQVRRSNIEKLTPKQIAFYDGLVSPAETYNEWLLRQAKDVQLRHLGDYKRVELFNQGGISVDRFVNPEGNSIGIRELRALSDDNYTLPNDTKRFAAAKAQLDAMQLGISRPEDLLFNKDLAKTLEDYYLLQSKELGGTLSLTNYRGALIHTKKAARSRVLTSPPREDQLKFNPITGRYEDVRIYQPNASVYANNLRLLKDSDVLKDVDKDFIENTVNNLSEKMGINERAVVLDNLRILFTRYRKDKEPWQNFKAVAQAQIKFDVMNVSDAIETQIRKDSDVLKKLLQDNYIDPVLGPVQLQDLHDTFVKNILEKNRWEDKVAPKIADELRGVFDLSIAKEAPTIWARLSDRELQQFYLKFANRLGMADSPDRDQFAVALGRDLHNLANYNGNRKEWYNLGMKLLNNKRTSKFFEIETFGVQKRRMKSRLSGAYFGPYYDTIAYNIRVTDPRIQTYAKLSRSVDVGLRVAVTSESNKLVFREGYKTYFIDRGPLGFEDSRIPITSTHSFSDFPEELVDKNLVDALNWAGKTQYKIDGDYYDFINKLLYFQDDKGRAKHFDEINEYRKFIAARGDSYERFKSMEWLRNSGKAFSNHPFLDHRARIYDRGMISPQSGETFRPFLNTAKTSKFSPQEFLNFQDQIGSFVGGLSDSLEGRYNSLTITGRQKIAAMHRAEMIKIGNHMLRGKPNDIRAVLESPMLAEIDGEDVGKFYRFALETAKIDRYLGGDYSPQSLKRLSNYDIAVALEQDASSSGAQIIALTTRNKQLAEMSNVVPTNQKRRLYDEIAAATYNDPRFKALNVKLGLTEKDLRKAAKAQNMVTFYGAGERTGILNVEGKLSKVLGKDSATLVVKAADRDTVLNEISAQTAKYERFDPETAEELRQLRANVRDIFNKGQDAGDDIMEQLWFLQPQTKALLEKMSLSYDRVVTPEDFKTIAKIMSEQLAEQVPILKDFTRFFGRLAQDFLTSAKPSKSNFDWKSIAKVAIRGDEKQGYTLPDSVSQLLGIKKGEAVSEKILRRFGSWKPNGTLAEILYGAPSPEARRTGGKFFKLDVVVPAAPTLSNLLKGELLTEKKIISGVELFYANKLPKSWTNVPWVNFDGKTIEQNFTQNFEERLFYKNPDGTYTTNILQVPQKTSADWWEELANKSGKINDIADATKARTAFAVNGNHSNDATLVKKFHLWGRKAGVPTSTIHDAFFANAAEMLNARNALRGIYAESLKNNVIKMTLDEMLARGLPRELYDKYLDEAIDIGLIPVPGRSRIGGKLVKESDILTEKDILAPVVNDFKRDYGWYGIG